MSDQPWASISARVPGLRFLRPAYRRTAIGLTVSQGDISARANLSRAIPPGFDGTGITVGTLSDSYDTASSPATDAGDDVTSGDLPSGIVVLDDYGQDNVHGTDEGRAMMQLIADLAPAAAQKFHTAYDGQAGFAQGILDLQAADCDVIVDDVFYFAEPFFQDGAIAQAVDTVFNLVIEIGATPNPGRLKDIHFDQGGTSSIDEYTTSSGTCVGHSNAAGAIAVGASAWFNTPAYGLSPAALNYFSSSGGVPVLFDTSGNTLGTPDDRGKPDFVAPDGGNTTFFGADVGADADSYPNFFGTSAAAPHAAAVAALLLQKAGGPGSLTPAEVRDALTTTALNMGPAGFDNNSGAGFVDAEAAMQAVPMAYPFWATLTFSGSTPAPDQLPDAVTLQAILGNLTAPETFVRLAIGESLLP